MFIYDGNTENDPFAAFIVMAGINCVSSNCLIDFENIKYPDYAMNELNPNFAAELLSEILTDSVENECQYDFTIQDFNGNAKVSKTNMARVRKVDFKNRTQNLPS